MEEIFSKGAKAGPADVEKFMNKMVEKWRDLDPVWKRKRLETFLKLLNLFNNFLPAIELSFVRLQIAGILIGILKQSPGVGVPKEESVTSILQRTALHVCYAYSEVSETISKELANFGGIPVLCSLMGKDPSYWKLEKKEFSEIQKYCVETLVNMCRKESDLQAFQEPRIQWVLKDYLAMKNKVTRIAAVSALLYTYGPPNDYVLKRRRDNPVYQRIAKRVSGVDTKNIKTETKEKPLITNEIDLLLIGKTGNGKSETANTILGRKFFESTAHSESVTKKVQYEYTKYKGRVITVVDAPGVGDTSGHFDKEKAIKMVTEAMRDAVLLNPKGYHAFLLVVRYGNRFTAEDIWVIKFLKAIFGQDFVKDFCILIMTCGDNFEKSKTENNGKTFEDWFRKQDGVFRQLLEECDQRIILFNNKTDDKNILNAQMNRLIDTVEHLKSNCKRYTDEHFLGAQKARDEFFIEVKEEIRQETLKQIRIIRHEFEELSREDAASHLDRLEKLMLQTEAMYKQLSETENKSASLEQSLTCVENLKNALENRINFEAQIKEARSELARKEEELRLKFEKEAIVFADQLEKLYETPRFQGQKWGKGSAEENAYKPDWKQINAEFTAILIQSEKKFQNEITEKEKKSAEILEAEKNEKLEEETKLKIAEENYEEVKKKYDNFVRHNLKSIDGKSCIIL